MSIVRVILSDISPQEVWRAADSDKSRPPTAYFCSGVVVIVMALVINISCSRRVKWKVVVVNTNTFRIKKLTLWKEWSNYLWTGPRGVVYFGTYLPNLVRWTMPCITRHDDVMTWEGFPHYWPFSWWRHQMETISASLAICAGNSWFALICARINGWANNREAGDLRRRCTNYDAIVKCKGNPMVTSHGRTHSSVLLIIISIATVSASV